MKKFCLLATAVCILLCASCSPGEPIPHQSYEDLDFEGPNISDLLFDYFADYYTDTYAIADGKVEIRAVSLFNNYIFSVFVLIKLIMQRIVSAAIVE